MRKIVRDIILDGSQFIGDLLSVRAVAWYGLRRIYASYTGFCLRVRKAVLGVNVFADIGFDINGDLDITALMAFAIDADSGNVFVSINYDKTGNGYHAIQTSVALQPSIVVGGVLQQINNRPAMLTTVPGQRLIASNPDFSQPNYISAVIHNPSFSGTNEIFIDGNSPTNRNTLYYSSATQVGFFAGSTPQITTLPSASIPLIFGALFAGANSILSINGSAALSANVGSASLGRIVLMADGPSFATAFSLTGFLSEAWVFSQNIPTPTDTQLLERSQGAYYGIAVS